MNIISGNITKYIKKHTIKLKLITGYINSALTTMDNIKYIIYNFQIYAQSISKVMLLN